MPKLRLKIPLALLVSSRRSLALLGATSLLAGGCITSAREESMRNTISQLETKINAFEKELALRDEKLKTIGSKAEYNQNASSSLEDIRRQLSLTQGAVDELRVKFGRLAESGLGGSTGTTLESDLGDGSGSPSLASLEQRVSALEKAIGQGGTVKTTPASRREPPKYRSPRELTKALGSQFSKKNYDEVLSLSGAVLASDLGADYQEIAQLFKAEAAFATENYKGAALDFSTFLTKFPKSERRARALLLAGDSFVYLKQFETAKSYYRECVERFPKKQECVASKERLDRLGS